GGGGGGGAGRGGRRHRRRRRRGPDHGQRAGGQRSMSAGNRQIGAQNGNPDEVPTTEVSAAVIVNAPAARVFEALVAWERQSEWIPFTTVKIAKGDGGVGSTIEAVTTIGPAVLTDTMRIEAI